MTDLARLSRTRYLGLGLGLMALKYAGDAAVSADRAGLRGAIVRMFETSALFRCV